jgi:CDP-diacylglycerol--glycerol-3-phosphate 3-phosphatidyltransferase
MVGHRLLQYVPNILTLLRLAMIVPVIVLFRQGFYAWAAFLFLVAMMLDVADGALARHLDVCSKFGTLLDPLVDKILILGLMYELVIANLLHAGIAHLFLTRELMANALRIFASSSDRPVGANAMGKLKAFMQTLIVAAGLYLPTVYHSFGEPTFDHARSLLISSAYVVLAISWIFLSVFAFRIRRS